MAALAGLRIDNCAIEIDAMRKAAAPSRTEKMRFMNLSFRKPALELRTLRD